MKTKHLESSGATAYHAPTTELIDFLVEQSVMAASSGVQIDVKGPEGYEIDEEIFNW